MIDFNDFDAMTFDCYGTLIDWETGIVEVLRPILARHGRDLSDDEILETYAGCETEAERGDFKPYRAVLREALRCLGARLTIEPSDDDLERFAGSVGDWPAFPDSPEALAQLKRRYRLGVITNCDDDLFAGSNRQLGVEFDWVVTAQQARSYKPAFGPFELAFARIGLPRARFLHVAQSLYHDHVPAKQLGLTTVWINRRQGKTGSGATPPAEARPDLEVPDLRTLAQLVADGREVG